MNDTIHDTFAAVQQPLQGHWQSSIFVLTRILIQLVVQFSGT